MTCYFRQLCSPDIIETKLHAVILDQPNPILILCLSFKNNAYEVYLSACLMAYGGGFQKVPLPG
jgi:hypothetical protein